VAVLGAGPAGVSAAAALASRGHKVVLLDGSPAPGGTAAGTIPADRLPDPILRREIDDVLASSGDVERRYNVRFDSNYGLDNVRGGSYDALLVALGLSGSVRLETTVRPKSGVVDALEFLAAVKRGGASSGVVLVLGGGNTAIDAALSAKRAGADDVSIVYRRSFAEMHAWPEERDRAIEAGVNFLILTQPVGYAEDPAGHVTGVKLLRTRLGEPDESGRRKPQEIKGSEWTLNADLVVEAIGNKPDAADWSSMVKTNQHGFIAADASTARTSASGSPPRRAGRRAA
jgi:glutamate synthase (NADPH/NADH) small chain